MKLAFLGSKALGLAVLTAVHSASNEHNWRIIHPLDDDDERSCWGDFAKFARKHNLEILNASSQAVADKMIQDYKPDAILVCGWYWLISPPILQVPPLGVFGIHNSLLPKYRGGSPLVWSIINGDNVVGATVFRFTEGMDDGPILYQVKVPLCIDDNISVALSGINNKLSETFPTQWSSYLRGEAVMTPQDESLATYCGQRVPEDGQIDWLKPAKSIHDFIRAQTRPYPGAYCYVNEQKVTIWTTEIDHRTYQGVPGQVLLRASDYVVIACGQRTAVKILDVSIDNAPYRVREVFRSVKLRLS